MKKLLLFSSVLLSCCIAVPAMASYYQWFRITNDTGRAIRFHTTEKCFKYNLFGQIDNGLYHEYKAEVSEAIGCSSVATKEITFYFTEVGKQQSFAHVAITCAGTGDANPTCRSSGGGGEGDTAPIPGGKITITASVGRHLHMTVSANKIK